MNLNELDWLDLKKYVCKNFVFLGEYFVYHILLLRTKGPQINLPLTSKNLGTALVPSAPFSRPHLFLAFHFQNTIEPEVNMYSMAPPTVTTICVSERRRRKPFRGWKKCPYDSREDRHRVGGAYQQRSRVSVRVIFILFLVVDTVKRRYLETFVSHENAQCYFGDAFEGLTFHANLCFVEHATTVAIRVCVSEFLINKYKLKRIRV
jgi:hypothetical protein